ncbi:MULTISPECIES: glycosyltransferase family 4 protein [unclassified Pseudoalteromonas]|uniref:glycosyltransferase family 4 protein n=1 Tax=unclassified Pseudoalteromonas TaxID=194690 RepID=UPI002580D9CB|nr:MULTISPECIES: glycosyltransferase family 4 protein [unclassified Pseudoalteromonas]|tara:strand:- start:13294 stop:14490 length:1197 start_codon:yes stop_codon:yes gene_type:complete
MGTKKRVVFISEYLGKDVNSTAYYWTKILESLSIDYDVLVISPDSKSNVEYLKSNNFEYILYVSSTYSKTSMFSRLWAYIKMSVCFYKASKEKINSSDVIISGTNSIFNMFFIARLKRKLNLPWLLFGYDIFPENLIPAGVISTNNPVYKLVSKIFTNLYSKPNDIVAVGRDMRELLIKKVSSRTRVHYIPNWAAHEEVCITDKSHNKIINELNWKQDEIVVFQFFGNLGVLQDIYGLLEAIELSKAPNAKFLFIGSGSEAANALALIQEADDDRIHFYGECDMAEKDIALNACDVAFVSLKKGMLGLAVPSKSYFSLAADKPIIVIGDEGAELRLLVDDYPIGWGCNSGDPVALAELIDDICFNKGCLLNMEPRSSLINHFSEADSLAAINDLVTGY